MIRVSAAAIVLAVAVLAVVPNRAPAAAPVDLNVPGVLEALAAAKPAHYDKIRKILDGVTRQPDAAVARWMQVSFDAKDVTYAPIVLTTHPAKRRLSFALDATRYVAVVTLPTPGAIVPLR